MGVKKLKPITPGQRFRVVNDFEQVTAAKPEKNLVKGKTKSGGLSHHPCEGGAALHPYLDSDGAAAGGDHFALLRHLRHAHR